MKQKVEVPQVGESVVEGILATWFKSTGEAVQEGEELFELETDKATMPVPAPASGVITILVDADTEVAVGTVVAEIDTEAAPAGTSSGVSREPGGQEDPQEESQPSGDPSSAGAPVSPAVRRMLEEEGVEARAVAAAVAPSGKGGRLTKGDVQRYLEGRATPPEEEAAPAPPAAAPAAPAVAAPGAPAAPPQERKRMSMIRRKIAENLVRSKQESAHLTTFNEVDMSGIMEIRSTYRETFEKRHGVRLGFMSFFIKAAQRALQEYPAVNAFVDGTDILYNHTRNIGVAISTDSGLVVPVIRNVDSRGLADLEQTIVDFAARARAKQLMPDEFAGGTFTITNGGVFGSMLSTPIPSPPQTAVLGMHSIDKRAVVVDDQIVIRPMMYLALTYDHRVIDGREAIGFLNMIKRQVQDPVQLLLEL